ncbi:16S rRNA (cytidine(1402)-2'-O)-methyltransferase [Salisediminibacterium beveridgei]|uniref:Ribosomal RNA small subunit methyltransferase I n=1 Tax=Salisediminibacterium beveridgei TaxID=632773 RepID=A0A1D7R053_9BACI|nr:16S rRNA (cytidine(1402)-2'-O)-methyltransferase [Salisediminibacterium beveridgei]AOM84635.1 rRNA small subunit methyltransferase I [Salisediminibacterium beveridgei]
MKQQQTFKGENERQVGMLMLVPTPIGNLQDMTYRAVTTLQDADVIAAEDTRHSKKLSHVFEITTPLISYHEHNKYEREQELVNRALAGEVIALVTDAGMPGISDPGSELVARFIEEDIPIHALPGANAAITALVSSGLATETFSFIGFLDRHRKKRKETLESWQKAPSTLIFYESPHRLKDMLKGVLDVLGDRKAVVSREISKQYETILRGHVSEILKFVEEEGIKGECVVLVAGADKAEAETFGADEAVSWWETLSIEAHVTHHVDEGMRSKEAIKQVAKERSLPKRDVYQAYHVNEQE